MKITLPLITLLITFLIQGQIDNNRYQNTRPSIPNLGSDWHLNFSNDFDGNILNKSKKEMLKSTKDLAMPLGLDNALINNREVFLSPNPTFNYAILTGLSGSYMVTVTDVTGRVIKTYNTASSSLKVDLSNNPSGLYLLRFVNQDNNTSFCKKLIKQ